MIHDLLIMLQTVEAYDILEQMTLHESVNFTNVQPHRVHTTVLCISLNIIQTLQHTTDPISNICDNIYKYVLIELTTLIFSIVCLLMAKTLVGKW